MIEWNYILRIFVAGLLGGAIGFEREFRAKEAGEDGDDEIPADTHLSRHLPKQENQQQGRKHGRSIGANRNDPANEQQNNAKGGKNAAHCDLPGFHLASKDSFPSRAAIAIVRIGV